ncbi:MAG: L,D-transpeptidase [Pseudomonadota bacterium]
MAKYSIDIDSRLQRLYLWEDQPDHQDRQLIREYPVSTAKNGLGERSGSFCTPRGRHRIAEKIGDGQPMFSVFRTRVPTGEIWSPQLSSSEPGRDWILSRILWLEGLEEGKNKGGTVDTHARYIYIHGTDEEHLIGSPASHGCIRMKNADIIDLFKMVEEGTEVRIS